MAITMMCEKDAPGAYLSTHYTAVDAGRDIFVRTFAVGKVVNISERNGYDDSDFYATFYDDSEGGEFKTIEYATTRGWTYPNGAAIDASPAVVDLYEEFKRGLALGAERNFRRSVAASLEALGLNRPENVDFFAKLSAEARRDLLKLLRTNCRSAFRKSLQEQARKWLEAAPEDRRYASPLSPKQMAALTPRGYYDRRSLGDTPVRTREILP